MRQLFDLFDRLAQDRAALLRARPDRRTGATQTIQIVFDREIYLIRLKRHRQARRYTLRIHAATREAVLTLPLRGSVREAKAFAEKHGAWLAARLKRLPESIPFVEGAIVPLRDRPHRIAHRPGRRGTVWTEDGEDGEPLLCATGDARHLARRVSDHLKREAHRELDLASRRAAERLGVTVRRIVVRDQVSRWGSCSSSGVLSYSWRLILAPPYVLDYLAIHEVAHLIEMNHSARFWRIVRAQCPEMARAKAWLDAHGAELHRYGAPPTA